MGNARLEEHKIVIKLLILSQCIIRQRSRTGVVSYYHRVRRLASLSVTKLGSHISWERFDLEPPNFTRISILTYSTATLDMASLFTSSRKLSWTKSSKIQPSVASDGISRERFKRGSWDFTHLSGSITLTNMLDMTSWAASGQLQNATKYRTKWSRRPRVE